MPNKGPSLVRCDRVRDELRALLASARGVRLTVQMPMHAPPELRQNEPLRRRAISEAARCLEAAGAGPADIAMRLPRLESSLREFGSLSKSGGTLVVLDDGLAAHVIPLASQLPFDVRAGRHFALRPLLHALRFEGRYRLLAVSVGRVALYEGDARGLEPVALGALPASLEDALGSEKSEKQLRMRGTRAGGGAPVYYAHDAADDERKIDAERFHHVLATAVNQRFENDAEPLVIASDRVHQTGLRAKLRLCELIEQPLLGSPDHESAADLHRRAWPLVCAARTADPAAVAAACERAHRAGKAVDLLDDVAAAAVSGRVRRLFVDAVRQIAGELDPLTGRLRTGEADQVDVLDALVEQVLLHDGDLIVAEDGGVPASNGVVAELR